MAANYNKLWKLLIDKGMTKTDLRIKTEEILSKQCYPCGMDK